mmetsp:Transcript_7494/g.10555  ORF Transcript_7494/g.10555 Transcript_7494/m.10555 type:complete len:281 (+) Transcript_7494:1483-2325(+)
MYALTAPLMSKLSRMPASESLDSFAKSTKSCSFSFATASSVSPAVFVPETSSRSESACSTFRTLSFSFSKGSDLESESKDDVSSRNTGSSAAFSLGSLAVVCILPSLCLRGKSLFEPEESVASFLRISCKRGTLSSESEAVDGMDSQLFSSERPGWSSVFLFSIDRAALTSALFFLPRLLPALLRLLVEAPFFELLLWRTLLFFQVLLLLHASSFPLSSLRFLFLLPCSLPLRSLLVLNFLPPLSFESPVFHFFAAIRRFASSSSSPSLLVSPDRSISFR